MAPQSNIIVFGGAVFGAPEYFPELQTLEDNQRLLDLLKAQGVNHLDTAQIYGKGNSEAIIGQLKTLEQGFIVDTKWAGGWSGKPWATQDNILSSYKESLEKLGVKKGQEVDIFYIHAPDVHVPFEETLKGVNEAYQAGGFKRFGLSNFTPDQVREVLRITKEKGYIQPTVYQGSYAAVARKPEEELLPLLREHKIAFYAYSPLAGGFLTKNRKFVEEQQGRFSNEVLGGIYYKLYKSESFLSLLDDWERIANEEGVSRAELAYRWINHHSALKPEYGDGIIFGATKFSQAEATPQYLKKGPLKESSVKQINELWDRVKNDAFIDNFQAAFGGSA